MKIALLGYGKEGKAAENYFAKFGAEFEILQNFTYDEIAERDFSDCDLVLRSPSLHPHDGWTSMTRYFFAKCPCPIIGVTGTKGKGTTCSFIRSILEALGKKVHLVGNIGIPSITILDDLQPDDVVVYELSSFQLWDMEYSPRVAVVVTIEPDHLNIHDSYEDYIGAKMNIARHQGSADSIVYYGNNPESVRIAAESPATNRVAYPIDVPADILDTITLPGQHNRENAMAAISAAACYMGLSVEDFIEQYATEIKQGLANFKGLPHRTEFLRNLNGVDYYDDNFSTNVSSTRVALKAFSDRELVVIIGGRDKTAYEDLPELYELLSTSNIKKIVLMGESGHELAKRYDDSRFIVVESLKEAVETARSEAEKLSSAIVLMSPSAASFDMFNDVYDRGAQFTELIKSLK